jgi:K(+)-stimulated pyrophosphate-energized sodium pump
MMLPGLLTIGFPLVITFLPMVFGMENMAIAEMLGGYMAGVTVSGVLWAIFQNNAGGAWDNAKKSFEAGVMIDGKMTYKGSEAHKAAVTGDTVGDPFKDTSGPSMNILIKLTCLIGLVIAPILGGHAISDAHGAVNTEIIMIDEDGNEQIIQENTNGLSSEEEAMAKNIEVTVHKEVMVEKSVNGDIVTANVTIKTTKDGETLIEKKTFSGTEAEVKEQLETLKGVDVKLIEEVEKN